MLFLSLFILSPVLIKPFFHVANPVLIYQANATPRFSHRRNLIHFNITSNIYIQVLKVLTRRLIELRDSKVPEE